MSDHQRGKRCPDTTRSLLTNSSVSKTYSLSLSNSCEGNESGFEAKLFVSYQIAAAIVHIKGK